MSDARSGATRVALAWGVHLFTASGALGAAAALLAIGRADFDTAVLWMLFGLFVDAVDGTMARKVGVARVLPRIDGRRLDDMVDFLNYVLVPAVFMVEAGLLTHGGWVVAPILASAYGFSQVDAKTADDFFLGWPSYWNVLAIYLWLLHVSPPVGTALTVFFAAAILVPMKYVYPSRLRAFRGTTALGAVVCILLVAAAVVWPGAGRRLYLVEASLFFPAWYLGLSAHLGGWLRGGRGGSS